jgi:predicted CoA-binding protein
MVTIKEAATEFLATKRVAVTGVSRNPQGHGGNVVYQRLRQRGYEVFAVNPNAETVEGDRAYSDLKSIPGGVEAVVIATKPETAETTMAECTELGINHVWMHRSVGTGSVSSSATEYGRTRGITVINGGCLTPRPTSDTSACGSSSACPKPFRGTWADAQGLGGTGPPPGSDLTGGIEEGAALTPCAALGFTLWPALPPSSVRYGHSTSRGSRVPSSASVSLLSRSSKANHVSAMTRRAGLTAGLSPGQATVAALSSASRADLFAGATVAVAMGLLMPGVSLLNGTGIAAGAFETNLCLHTTA